MGCLTRVVGAGAVCAVGVLGSSAALAQTPTLRIEHAAAIVVISAENRSDIVVSVSGGAARLPPLKLRRDGAAVVVDGGLDTHSLSCDGGYGMTHVFGGDDRIRDTRSVRIPGVGRLERAELPVVTVHAPRALAVAAEGAVWGSAGSSESLDLALSGCGDWSAGPVRSRLSLDAHGSGDVSVTSAGTIRLASSGSADIDVGRIDGAAAIANAGSGDVRLGPVGGALDARLAGSGDLTADRVGGAIKAEISGSSDIKIKGGRTPQLAVQVSGSGGFTFNGVAGAVSATVSGSGDIHVARADGPVARSVAGTGDISIGR